MALPVYNSEEVKVAYGGFPLEGLAQDSFVVVSYSSDFTSEGIGADGQTQISLMPGKQGTCKISLQQGSLGNMFLAAIANLIQSEGVLPSATLTVTDPAGSVLAVLRNAHLKTAPEIDLGSDASDKTRDWTFFVEEVYFASSPEGLATAIAQSDVDQIIGGVDSIRNYIL